MKERINKIMEMKGMNSSQFAVATGLNPATLSNILSGKTYPSTEVLTKILEKFSDISSDWLLLGKGEVLRTGGTPSVSDNRSLFSFENQSNERNTTVKKEPETSKNIEKEVIYIEKPAKTIDKLLIFYSDNSFETFIKG
ncbi:MAG: helix-turn-helix domain-containing protein [Prevotellaceae bacterium]|jgi:transcriptional regulator with XRE-family HTH domain|nr:helix-turn-helix domain-containing protein [Prevotellaceae bacterium]